MVVIRHDGTTDGNLTINSNGLSNTSQLELISGTNDYSLPTGTISQYDTLQFNNSGNLELNKKHIVVLRTNSAKNYSNGDDIVWDTTDIDIGDIAVNYTTGQVVLPENCLFNITLTVIGRPTSTDVYFEIEDFNGNSLGPSLFIPNPRNQATLNFVYSTYNKTAEQKIIKATLFSGAGPVTTRSGGTCMTITSLS